MNNNLKTQGFGMAIGLMVQFILGILSNLYVSFPQKAKEQALWEFAWKQIPLALHIILGILLLIGSIVFVIRSLTAKNSRWIMVSIIGALSILISGFAGAQFVSTQNDLYSFIMSIGFITALFSYMYGVYADNSK